ncbi:MAG: hypothetical protein F9K49_07755 [Caedimonadaceae bacterium]|nr:MAG: hypothetical protein F9K49_07755 [Caedimonadaceae bacterium]
MRLTFVFLLFAVLTYGCTNKIEPTPVEVNISETGSSKTDVTVEFVNQSPYQGLSNYFLNTFCVSNNSTKTFDSVKVTFTNVVGSPAIFKFVTVKPNEKYYPVVNTNGNSGVPIKTLLEWW